MSTSTTPRRPIDNGTTRVGAQLATADQGGRPQDAGLLGHFRRHLAARSPRPALAGRSAPRPTADPRGWRRLLPVGHHGWLLRCPGYTAAEVRALLREGTDTARGRAVWRCLARPGDWLDPPPNPRACPTRYDELLPRIVFWYARGEECGRIAMRLRGQGSTWGVGRALELACEQIAACLNRDPEAYEDPG